MLPTTLDAQTALTIVDLNKGMVRSPAIQPIDDVVEGVRCP
jgi:hypothetical protein